MQHSGQHSYHYGYPGGEQLFKEVAWGKAAGMPQAVMGGNTA